MKISVSDFSTNRKMLDKNVLRYCENYYQYVYHLTHYFNEDLNVTEFRWLVFLIQRIEFFLDGAPCSSTYSVIVGRYKRVLKKLLKIRDSQPLNTTLKCQIQN